MVDVLSESFLLEKYSYRECSLCRNGGDNAMQGVSRCRRGTRNHDALRQGTFTEVSLRQARQTGHVFEPRNPHVGNNGPETREMIWQVMGSDVGARDALGMTGSTTDPIDAELSGVV